MEYKIIKINEKEYPKKLKKIYAPPQELYVLGNSEILNENSIAIVGCRNCSTYGKVWIWIIKKRNKHN